MGEAGIFPKATSDVSRDEDPVRILVVDDQPANLIALEAVLDRSGYELVRAQSGRRAFELMERHEFAVILLDVQMPILDGFQTARLIRQVERFRTTPIIFLTANYPSDEHVMQGYGVGAVDYLLKPFNSEVLRAKVAVFVDLFRKTCQIQRQAEVIREIERSARERELAEAKRISERKYRNLVEGIREGFVWSTDPSAARFSFVSAHAERILGYPLSQWMSEEHFWERRLHPEDRERVLRTFHQARSGDGAHGIEHRMVRTSGEVVWLHTEVHLEPEAESGTFELRGLSVDVTHLKETEKALLNAVHVRDEFLSIASHELRTPITPLQLQMQGFIRLINTERLGAVPVERLREMLEISDSQVTRLARLIGQLLDVSRINAGQFVLHPEPLRLSEVVSGVIDQLRHELENAECRLIPRLDPEIEGRWDRLRLEQALINLLTNSLKYGAGKPIEVSLTSDGRRARLAVRDYGIGIAKADHARIFERFERAVSAKHFGGLGLGLYIAKQIVELHHGTIRVESEPGRGATFIVELPFFSS